MYKLKGELKVISDTQQISDAFKKREFVVTDSAGQYAQDIQFQAVQDRTELLNDLKVGDNVEVTFFLRGREWVNPKDGVVRYFNSLDAWKVEKVDSLGYTNKPNTGNENANSEGENDLPF